MKKVLFSVLIAGLIAMMSACGGSQTTKDAEAKLKMDSCEQTKACCKELTEEQKAEMTAWNDWANQTPEKQQELIAGRKACIDKMMAEKKESCEAKEGEVKTESPEKAQKCAEFKAKWDNWANLTIEEQKVLIDEACACSKKCEKKEGCCEKPAEKKAE